MTAFKKNQRVFVKENSDTDRWIPANGRSGGLWIEGVTGNHCIVFDGQGSFVVPSKDLVRGDESKDITYF